MSTCSWCVTVRTANNNLCETASLGTLVVVVERHHDKVLLNITRNPSEGNSLKWNWRSHPHWSSSRLVGIVKVDRDTSTSVRKVSLLGETAQPAKWIMYMWFVKHSWSIRARNIRSHLVLRWTNNVVLNVERWCVSARQDGLTRNGDFGWEEGFLLSIALLNVGTAQPLHAVQHVVNQSSLTTFVAAVRSRILSTFCLTLVPLPIFVPQASLITLLFPSPCTFANYTWNALDAEGHE